MVTSSAVVGSSASSSFGPGASAMAIIARWRMPPEIRAETNRAAAPHRGCPPGRSSSIARCARGTAAQPAMHRQALGNLQPDRQHRVQRGHRFLEHDRDVLATHRGIQLGLRQRQQIGAPPEIRPPTAACAATAPGSRAASGFCPSRIRRPAPAPHLRRRRRSTPSTGCVAPKPTLSRSTASSGGADIGHARHPISPAAAAIRPVHRPAG